MTDHERPPALTLSALPVHRDLMPQSQASVHLMPQVSDFDSTPASRSSPGSGSATPGDLSTTSSSSSPTQDTSDKSKNSIQEPLDDLSNYIPMGVMAIDQCRRPNFDPESKLAHLEKHKWIKTETVTNTENSAGKYVRIYLLPDDRFHTLVPRGNPVLRSVWRRVLSMIHSSADAWNGLSSLEELKLSSPGPEDESLFYIFNTLESPNPNAAAVTDRSAREAMEDLLWKEGTDIEGPVEDLVSVGLKTPLYQYQRRSAAFMIQRESQPAQVLDPRLQIRHGPTGQEYYHDRLTGEILSEKRFYSEACGGILAETMGYGKTLICLSVILATRGHFPRIPSIYLEKAAKIRSKTASLLETAAAAAGHHSVPWKRHFENMDLLGLYFERCVDACKRNYGAYTIPPPIARYQRRQSAGMQAGPTHLRLCSGTLIVVPPNLVDHWKREIEKHTFGLKTLVLRFLRDRMPSADELLEFDIILFAKPRFELEAPQAPDRFAGKGIASAPYVSPLRQLHWLRIIVDEGHNFAGTGHKTLAAALLEKLHVERRWVVSGTPSQGLYGVEVSLASEERHNSSGDLSTASTASVLDRKKKLTSLDEELKDLDKLRFIVTEFLNVRPWANSGNADTANWNNYMRPTTTDGKRGLATTLRATLQGLVVRHRAEDINNDVPLPGLYNKVVHLEPTFYDKLSINLFIFQLKVNAVTSERTDADYMFHLKNRKHLRQLISNLRHAGFWWTGFGKQQVEATINIAREYLEKNVDKVSKLDFESLCEGIKYAERAITCECRNAFSELEELGVFVQDFPAHARGIWALDSLSQHQQPLLLGISQAILAQKFVSAHLNTDDPAEGIAGAGIKAKREIRERAGHSQNSTTSDRSSTVSKRPDDKLVHRAKPERSPKKSFSKGLFKELPSDSSLAATKLVATASAKLTYLLQKVIDYQETEKIIIFYENNNSAFWIAEGLELLGVEFRIYASTLRPQQRSNYLAMFNESEKVRVLLMDLRQASHGLHIACASRVFIVNPIWQPTVESQAIKRAHRISQSKPVYVETLVLKGSLEDKMLQRRKAMSNQEMKHAAKDLLDDKTMVSIIQDEGFLPLDEDEATARPAYLATPQGFFDRHRLPIPDNRSEMASDAATSAIALTSPLKRKLRDSVQGSIPWVQSDVESFESGASGGSTPKRRRSLPTVTIVGENGIVMSPPKRRSPSKRSPG